MNCNPQIKLTSRAHLSGLMSGAISLGRTNTVVARSHARGSVVATIADTGGDRRVAPTCSAESADPPKLSRHEWWALTAFCAVALALTMADLGARSLWVDELHTAFVAASRGRSLWDASTFDGGNMLAYYAFMNLWVHVFGTSPVALRLPSAIAGAGLVPVGYLLGRRSGGMKPGAAAALLLAVSPPLVVWAQQARGYSIAVVGVGLAWLALLRARALPSVPRLCLFVALSVACTYELLTASLVVAAGLLWLFFGTSERRLQLQTLACGAAYAICCVPLALVVHRSGVSGQVAWVAPPDLGSARRDRRRARRGLGARLLPVAPGELWTRGHRDRERVVRPGRLAESEDIWSG